MPPTYFEPNGRGLVRGGTDTEIKASTVRAGWEPFWPSGKTLVNGRRRRFDSMLYLYMNACRAPRQSSGAV